jgi:hypothetical protein
MISKQKAKKSNYKERCEKKGREKKRKAAKSKAALKKHEKHKLKAADKKANKAKKKAGGKVSLTHPGHKKHQLKKKAKHAEVKVKKAKKSHKETEQKMNTLLHKTKKLKTKIKLDKGKTKKKDQSAFASLVRRERAAKHTAQKSKAYLVKATKGAEKANKRVRRFHHGSAKPHYYFYKGHIRFHGKPHLLGKKKKKAVAKPTSFGKLSKHAAKKKLSTLTSSKVKQGKVKFMAAKKNLKGVMDKVKREKGNLSKIKAQLSKAHHKTLINHLLSRYAAEKKTIQQAEKHVAPATKTMKLAKKSLTKAKEDLVFSVTTSLGEGVNAVNA